MGDKTAKEHTPAGSERCGKSAEENLPGEARGTLCPGEIPCDERGATLPGEDAARGRAFAVEVERALTSSKGFRRALWRPFVSGIKRYGLLSAGDRVAVCISGGKDSMLLALLMRSLQKYSEMPFSLVYLAMDPGYSPDNRVRLEQNAALLGVPLTIFSSDIFAVANGSERNPCYLCARMRRGCLYARARELGCNKIALGHHLDDVIETTVLSMLYGAQLQAMPPRLESRNFAGMELIRPLYRVREEDIVSWRDEFHLTFLRCACRFTEGVDGGEMFSRRQEVKQLLASLEREHPGVKARIFASLHNLRAQTFPREVGREE